MNDRTRQAFNPHVTAISQSLVWKKKPEKVLIPGQIGA
uniref:Uncharacterized protein n=1 Tax=Anguilla anguilla TaxID=7936 RepID=A0A0E9XU32_ANGAN